MALDYGSVKDMYDTLKDSGVTTQTLPEWSQEMNELTGTELYTAGLHDNWIKRASHGIDKVLESTGLPGYGEQLGRTVGSWVGAPEAGAEVGRGLPRATLNFAPLLIPGGGVPAAIGKFALTGALTGAEAYEKTDSPLSALIAAGTATALPGIAGKTSEAVGRVLSRSIGVPSLTGPIADLEGNIIREATQYFPRTATERLVPKIGGEIAGQVAGAGAMGVSQPLEQLARGEEPTSPFTVENLLGLTLGQAPFAAIHLGKQALGKKPPALRMDEFQKALDLSKARIDLKAAKKQLEDQTGVEQIPPVTQPPPEQVPLATVRQTQAILSSVRGEMIKIKDNPNLTDEQKIVEENRLSQLDYDATRQRDVKAQNDTLLGDQINDETPRTEVIGAQLYGNRTGTFRAIHVSDDPFNPEELRGKVIRYSTKNERGPKFGVQSMEAQYGNLANYDLPPEQWRTVHTLDEYNAMYPKRPGKKFPLGYGTPELPTQVHVPTSEEVSAMMHELEQVHSEVDAANTTADVQQTTSKLNAVEAENDFTPTNDASLTPVVEQLDKAGVDPDTTVKTAVKRQATRTARKVKAKAVDPLIKAGFDQATIDAMTPEQRTDALAAVKSLREQERTAPEPSKEETSKVFEEFGGGGFSIITADKLSHANEENSLETQPPKDMVVDHSAGAVSEPAIQSAFDGWEGREDTTLVKDLQVALDLTEKYGSLSRVPPAEAGQFLAARTGAVPWDASEVTEFLNRPHIQELAREVDRRIVEEQKLNETPVSAPIPDRIVRPAGNRFLFAMAPYDPVTNRLGGKHTLPKNSVIDEATFQKIGGVGKPLTKPELDLYKLLVPEAFEGGKVNVNFLDAGLKNKGPVVETKVLGGPKEVPPLVQEMNELQHSWYDNLPDNVQSSIRKYVEEWNTDPTSADTSSWLNQAVEDMPLHRNDVHAFRETAERWADLHSSTPEGWDEVGGGPQYPFVAPKPENQMPGYVEGLVRLPRTEVTKQLATKDAFTGEQHKATTLEPTLYTGPHFGAEDKNVLAFFRGYEETLPNGEKAFHVIEVQSDWAQRQRDQGLKISQETNPDSPHKGAWKLETPDGISYTETKEQAEFAKDQFQRATGHVGHPLLDVYNNLALKAAVQHAKDVGATKLILSDAETAMMTEGHDLQPLGGRVTQGTEEEVRNYIQQHNIPQEGYTIARQTDAQGNPTDQVALVKADPTEAGITQAKGMRLNYDQKLPSAMEKLTGQKGTEVDLGTHKNAVTGMVEDPMPEEGWRQRLQDAGYTLKPTENQRGDPSDLEIIGPDGLVHGTVGPGARQPTALMGSTPEVYELVAPTSKASEYQLKGSPVFKNERGAPKTNVTGRQYDISQVPSELTLTEPTRAPGTAARADAPVWTPQEQRDIDTIERTGLARGGTGMLGFLAQSKNPIFQALARDLAKFTDSLARVSGNVRDMDGGAYLKRLAGQNYEVSLSPAMLRSNDATLEYAVAHELVHGLTLAELDNPTNVHVYNQMDDLRKRVADQLPKDMSKAFANAINTDWYRKWGNRQTTYESLMPNGTPQQRDTLYSLLSTPEFVSQGLTSHNFRNHLRGVKAAPGQTLFNQFANYVKTLLQLGDKISGTAFEEFLSHTSQLLDRGNYVASFRNFSDRYFENLGMSQQYVNSNTQRAMGLILSDHFTESPLSALILLRMGSGGVRSPEWAKAQADVGRMFNEQGEDALNTKAILTEIKHAPGHSGLLDLADSLMLGEEGLDTLDVLPEPAARFVFETVKDAQNIMGAINAAAREGNSGVLNIAQPEFIRGVAKETLAGIQKVVEASRMHDMQVKDLQGLFGVTPQGFIDKIVSAPDALPPEILEEPTGEPAKRGIIARTLEPTAQIARRIPESAEVIDRGYQLKANVRHMAREALKALGMDLTTMRLTPKTVKAMFKTFTNPSLRKAADKWIATNNIEGEKAGKGVKVIDADDPRIQSIIGGLSAGDREIVEDMVNKHSMSTQQMQDSILEKGLQIASTEGGALVQKVTGGKFKDSQELASRLLRAFTADRTDPNAAAVADSEIKFVQERMLPDQFLQVAQYTKAAGDHWLAQKAAFDANPGWSTAKRFGKYLVEFRKDGKVQLHGVDSKKEAEALAEGRPYKMKPNTKYDEDRPPGLGFDAPGVAERLRQYEQNMRDILQNTGTFDAEQIELMKKYSASEQFVTEQAYRGGVQDLAPQPRRLTKGAEEQPWLRNHVSWIHQTSNYWSRKLLRSQVNAHLKDPEIASNEQLRNDLKTHFDNMLQPDTAVGRFMQKAAMTWFMGANPASALINATQAFVTHVAEFTALTGKPLQSYRRVLSALKEVTMSGVGHREWKDPETAKFMERFIKDGEADVSMFDDEAAGNELLHTNLVKMLSGDKPQTLGQKLATVSGNFSNASMMLFRGVERVNAMTAGIAAFKYIRESRPNLSWDQAYTEAVRFHHAVNYGGGAAARPIGAFSGRGAFPRTTAMLATAMQSYNLGVMSQLSRYIQRGFFRPAGLTPAEVHAARTAVVQMLGTQLVAAGALGLPFVSGMVSVLNQAFPQLELRRKMRETMNAVFGGDEDNGSVLADIGMTGVPSMFGWDLQSRLSMGNTVPGVSEINGFQPELVLGAPVNLVSSFIRGGYKLASGDVRGVDDFMPSALKKIEQLLRSGGQVLDYRDRPIFTPTLGEKVGIALGFNPKRLSDFNSASRIAKQADDNIKAREGQFHQQMGEQVLKGNFGNVRAELQRRIREDKTYDPHAAVRAIASAAEGLTFPRDLRREGTVAGGDVRSKLLASFNLPPSGPSEEDRLMFRQGVQQRLGLVAPSPMGLPTARVMDELRRQNPAASRAELRQQATLLLHGRRPRTLGEPVE